MKPHKQIDTQDVGALTRQILQRKTSSSSERFCVEMPVKDLANAIFASYAAQTRARGAEVIRDEATLGVIHDAARWLADPEGKPGLMLQGVCGNGKTTLMMAIVDIVGLLYDSARGSQTKRFEVWDARQIARLAYREDEAELHRLRTVELLAIDDLGEEPAEIIRYGMTHTPVKDLLLERYKRNGMTIVTTNLINSPGKPRFSEHYGERVADRFREMMHRIVFLNPSYRK